MSGDGPVNIAASVHARLKNVGRDTKRDFNVLLIRYALERFLYRISRSEYCDSFVLKGALLFVAWENALERPTRDLDLLTFADPDIAGLEQVFREICCVDVKPDGLIFDPSTVSGSVIREGAIHDGVRMKFTARLGSARNQLQVDVGFGDAVVPPPSRLDFPVLLDQDPPENSRVPAGSSGCREIPRDDYAGHDQQPTQGLLRYLANARDDTVRYVTNHGRFDRHLQQTRDEYAFRKT